MILLYKFLGFRSGAHSSGLGRLMHRTRVCASEMWLVTYGINVSQPREQQNQKSCRMVLIKATNVRQV